MNDELKNEFETEAESPLLKKKENSGEYLWRVLKPAGCFLVLVIFIVYLVFCFTYRSDPAAAPQPTEQVETAEN